MLFEKLYGQSSNIFSVSTRATAGGNVDIASLSTLGLTNFSALNRRLVVLSWSVQAVSTANATIATLRFQADSTGGPVANTVAQWDTPAAANLMMAASQTYQCGVAPPRRAPLTVGTSTGGTATTLVDTSKNFTTLPTVPVVGDLVVCQQAFGVITVVAATTLTFGAGWVGTAPPVSGVDYYVIPSFRKLQLNMSAASTWDLQVELALVIDPTQPR